jgi:hypothetical protein
MKIHTPNHLLHRTPPRNAFAQAGTSGCTLARARRPRVVEGGAGELKERHTLERRRGLGSS